MPQQTPKGRTNGPSAKPLTEPLRVAKLGSFHSDGICSWCGALSSEAELRVCVLVATRAEAVVCVDRIACLRRARGAE